MFRLSKVGVGDEGAEASSRTDAQAGGALRRSRDRPVPTVSIGMVLSQLRQHERAGVEDFMVMRTSCALHGRKMQTTDVLLMSFVHMSRISPAGDGLCR